MRGHSHDHSEDVASQAPSVRHEHDDSALLWRAAVAGRTDVVGARGMAQIQRAIGNTGTRGMLEEERSPVLDVVSSGGGRPLDEPVRTDMEARLGHSFSDVRVHTDGAASASAASVNAHAYTVGSNIVFQRDKYDPGSQAGRTMIAHELTHVVQQRSGPVDGTATGSGVRVSDPSDRFEREAAATAERAVAAPAPPTAQLSAAPGGVAIQRHAEEETAQGAFLQRDEAEEEDTAQGTFVQREEEQEDESAATAQGMFVQRDEEAEEEQA